MDNEFYFAEQYRLAGEEWADKEAAAHSLESMKSAVLAQMKTKQGQMPDNRAERIVKASPEWLEYIQSEVAARKAANLAKVKMEYMRMRFYENQSREANARTEARL